MSEEDSADPLTRHPGGPFDQRGPGANEMKKISRRAWLRGAAVGATGVAAVGVGAEAVRRQVKTLVTPSALPPGEAPRVAQSFQDSRPAAAARPEAPKNAPNLVVIILDDVGFADLGCYGSEIRTPAMDSLAAKGLRYTNFRTCAMCSPTRAALMTGLNSHSAGMGWLADLDLGYAGYRGDLTHEAATLAEVLRDSGWSTWLCGKWHLNNADTTGPQGPYDNWPTQRGFDRAYWYQGHSTDYFKPSELFDGVAPVEPPAQEDYFVCDDLTDRAVTYIRTHHSMAAEKPFFLKLAFPGAHSPLQARARERDVYKGRYDEGWDVVRAQRLERQRAMGIVPQTTQLPPLSFGADAWDKLGSRERRLYARYMEVYAGLVTNVDTNIGRLLATLDELGIRENTAIVLISDNGGSAEGTTTGTPNVFGPGLGRPVPLELAEKLYESMGEDGTFPHYPMGWANVSNTPYRMYKQRTHLGGVADPFILSWPARIASQGEVRQQFVHVVDLFPTLLEIAGAKRPVVYKGQVQKPLEGQSIAPTFADTKAATRKDQYFELAGNRAFFEDPWRLVARHERGKPFDEDRWELYNLSDDPNELVDLSAAKPDVVERLREKFDLAAKAYGVYPLDDRNLVIRLAQDRQRRLRKHWEFHPPVERIARDVGPIVGGLDHRIEVEFEPGANGARGVLVAQGSKHAGYVLFVDGNGHLVYETAMVPWRERMVSKEPLPKGSLTVRYVQTMRARPFEGDGALFVNERKVAERKFDRVLLNTSYDGFSIGADLGNQVSSDYQGSNPFQGKIRVVRIDIDITPNSPLEMLRYVREMTMSI